MSKCRPSKWIIPAIVGAGLPLLGAYVISSGKVVDDVNGRAMGALSGNDMTKWATLATNGRDVTLSGTAPNQEALDAAVKTVAGTYGVRTLAQNVTVAPPPPPPEALAAPTVEPMDVANTATPTFKGTWPEGKAAGFDVKIGDDTYTWGKSPELKSDGAGNWTLTPSKPLAAGTVNVMPEVIDSAGAVIGATAVAMATINPPAPAPAPAKPNPVKIGVTSYAVAADGRTIEGRWAEGVAKTLTATLNGREYVANRGAALVTDGKGGFTFSPSAKLAPGKYPIEFKSTDADGHTVMAMSEIVVAEPAPPPPAAKPKPAPVKIGVTSYAVAADGRTIDGRWSEGVATSLTATLNGREYIANRGAALITDGKGMFTFSPSAKLVPGTYPVEFKSTDAAGHVVVAMSQIVVPEPPPPPPPPPPPKIEISADAMATGNTIVGKWSEGIAKTLTATLAGREYVANRGAALLTDGKGGFTFSPSAKLAPGTYPVEFMSMDGTGQMVVASSKIVVAEAPKVEPPPAPPAKPEMAAPAVMKQLDLTGAPIVRGSWPNDLAKALTVTLNGKTYTLGQDANLHVKDGSWSLLPSAGLKDGIYDVVAAATDADGVTKKDETVAELEVDGVPPAAPTVASYEGVKSPEAITGTYDAKQATGLKVTVPAINVTAELGAKDSVLTADGDGNWTMKMSTPLAPGKYDVNAESTDIRSRIQVDATAGEVVVTAPAPAPAGYDCVAVLNRVDTIFPIRFAYDHADVQHPYDLTLQYYAAVLKDARCVNVKVEVGGHTDFHGSEKYNQGLSERRSQTIIDMLAKDGIDATRLVKKGYSKDKPLDPATTDEARMKNRRVEITTTSN